MKADSIIFDLDGTLWDSTQAVTATWNAVMRQHCPGARAEITRQEILGCMGLLLPDIWRKLFPAQPPAVQQAMVQQVCRDELTLLEKTGGILYPRLEETLRLLHEQFALLIVSNCQAGYIECFLKAHRLERWFCDFENPDRTGQPKAGNIEIVVRRNGLRAPVYVGDTALDGQSARQAGVPFIHARYGFGQSDDFDAVIDSIDQLPGILEPAGR